MIDDFKQYVDERHGGIEENLQSKLDHLDTLIASGSSMLQDRFSELQAKVEKVHFFHAPFYKYKNSRLYNGDFAALHSKE